MCRRRISWMCYTRSWRRIISRRCWYLRPRASRWGLSMRRLGSSGYLHHYMSFKGIRIRRKEWPFTSRFVKRSMASWFVQILPLVGWISPWLIGLFSWIFPRMWRPMCTGWAGRPGLNIRASPWRLCRSMSWSLSITWSRRTSRFIRLHKIWRSILELIRPCNLFAVSIKMWSIWLKEL